MKKEIADKLAEIQAKQDIANFESNLTRARSVTVGTCFGGTTELMMRGNDGSVLWSPMQPVEVIELIHQLAANVGCHLALTPRQDFSSWREWRVSEAEKKHLGSQAPSVNDMAVFQQLGATNFDQAQAEAIVANNLAQKEYDYSHGYARKKELDHEPTMATKKTVDKRSTKRASKAS
jgi:dienelactone hydrolase